MKKGNGKSSRLKVLSRTVPMLIITVIWVIPLFWAFLTSLQSRLDISSITPIFIFTPTLVNYVRVFTTLNALFYLTNSFIVAGATTAVSVLLGTMAAYAFTRFKFRGSNQIALWILSVRFVPSIVTLIPVYYLFVTFGLTNTYYGMILAELTFALPFVVWLMQAFLQDMNKSIEEAGLVDGLTHLGVLRRIVFPIARPAIAVTALFVFAFTWNEFVMAFVLSGGNTATLVINLTSFSETGIVEWGPIFAGSMLSILPLIIIALFLQKHIARGLSLGAVKD
jgi:multiple sugar transport system permease protein